MASAPLNLSGHDRARAARDRAARGLKGWCDQCERRVSRGEADACAAKFCKMKGNG